VVLSSLLLDLQRATHVTLDALAAELTELGITASEANVLANLADGASLTASALAARVGSRPTTMTAVLDRLAGRGWVVREPHPSDRRAVVLRLTATGRRVARTVAAAYVRVEADVLADLSPTAARSLRRSLQRIGAAGHAR
jgi:DNA-binding MarR family transcriptional regulator